jgi:hypothetical protein
MGGRYSLDLAAAIASSPYGIPNLPRLSRELRNRICSGVGPALGYESSVRTSVVGIGDEMLSDVRDMVGDWERVRMRESDESDGEGLCVFAERDVEGRCVDTDVEGRCVDVEGRGDVVLISTDSVGAGPDPEAELEPDGLLMWNRPRWRKTDLRLGLTVASASVGTGPRSVESVDGSVVCAVSIEGRWM